MVSEEGRSNLSPEELFEHFVSRSEDCLSVIDTEGRLLWVNATCRHVYGLEAEDCFGHSSFDFVHPDDREAVVAAFKGWVAKDLTSPFQYEKRLLDRSGEVHELLWVVEPIRDERGSLRGFATSARDITDRKRAERALERSEAAHRAILASVLDPTVTIDGNGTVLAASESVREVFGYTPEELVGQNVRILMSEPHRSQHDGYLEKYKRTGETNILGRTREFEVVRKDGQRIVCDLSVARVDVPGQKEPFFTGSFRDVTKRKAAERALRESERRFRAIFDQEYQYVGLLGTDGRVVLMNRAALEVIDREHDDVVGEYFWDTPWWTNEDDRERLRKGVDAAARGEFVRFECEVGDVGRQSRYIDFSLKPIQDEDGNVLLLLPEGRDITEIKQAQETEQRMFESLAAIGESASILAHEIKNPITAINLALRAVADKLGEDQEVILRDMIGRLERVERMMRRTLSFAKPLTVKKSICGAREVLESVSDEMTPELERAGTRLSIDVQEDDLEFSGSSELLQETLTNIVRNAVQALDGGGHVFLSAWRDDGSVVLVVEDDGEGILPSVRDSLFKPFVTTKAEGTGLGLPICKKIIEAHGGTIRAERASVGGARFEIRLPL